MVGSAVVTGDSGGRIGSIYLYAQIPLCWRAWAYWNSLFLLVPPALCGVWWVSWTHRCLGLCFVPASRCMVLHRLSPTEGLSLHCRTPPCYCCAPLGLEHSKVHRPTWVSGKPGLFPLVGSVFPVGCDLVSAASSLQFFLWGTLLAGCLLSQTVPWWSGLGCPAPLCSATSWSKGIRSRAFCHLPHCPCCFHLQDAAQAFPQQSCSPLAQERSVLSPASPLLPPVPEHWGRLSPFPPHSHGQSHACTQICLFFTSLCWGKKGEFCLQLHVFSGSRSGWMALVLSDCPSGTQWFALLRSLGPLLLTPEIHAILWSQLVAPLSPFVPLHFPHDLEMNTGCL